MPKKSTQMRRLEVTRLDQYFDSLHNAKMIPMPQPRGGWVKTIRQALGMSAKQLAHRLGVSRAAIYSLEERETNLGITLKQLHRAAAVLECEFVYALVPKTTIENTIRNQAKNKAHSDLSKANASMSLEAEGVEGEKFITAVTSASSYSEALTNKALWDPKYDK
ncbi:MAG: mobile mystery protein A [Pseudomonadota bacterium]